ncbi:MAG TPA: methionyl-tRNA formyltransferase, partial [Thermoanaerobaculia bacterium]|nr:methionyl-tRNA formyltransferase [Thermoanaerobaculia bacterium]
RPPRPAGRGQRLEEPPVARRARALGLPLLQPERVRAEPFLAALAALRPDAAVVVAFGQLFPRALLDLPAHGCINLHASLLPRWRGAAPIQAAIAAGDRVTGVTTMRMEEGLDTGPLLLREEVAIEADETAGELAARLARRGAELLVRTLDGLAAGTLVPRPQREEEATYAPRLTRASGRADWSLAAEALADRLRAFTPWPGLWATLRGAPVKLVAARAVAAAAAPREPFEGTVLGLAGGRLEVLCGGGTVLGVETLQRPGRRPLPAPAFANGERLRAGERFA